MRKAGIEFLIYFRHVVTVLIQFLLFTIILPNEDQFLHELSIFRGFEILERLTKVLSTIYLKEEMNTTGLCDV